MLIRQAPHVVSRIVDGQVVLVSPRDGKVRVLNEVGTDLWESMRVETSVEQLTTKLITQFDLDAHEAHRDVVSFVDDLLDRQLLTPLPA